MELFVEQGFAETTVPQIAARAGLTTRTFFRHFADKREVLFTYQGELPAVVEGVLADAPASNPPMQVIADGLQTVAATRFQDKLEYLLTRRRVIESDDGLRERELRKQSILSDAVTAGLRRRGVDELTAAVTAQVGVGVLGVAIERWLDANGERSLPELLDETLDVLRALAADPAATPRSTSG